MRGTHTLRSGRILCELGPAACCSVPLADRLRPKDACRRGCASGFPLPPQLSTWIAGNVMRVTVNRSVGAGSFAVSLIYSMLSHQRLQCVA